MPRKLKIKGEKPETKVQKEMRELRNMEFNKEEREKYKFVSTILTASRIFTVEVCDLFNLAKQQKEKNKIIELCTFNEFKFSSFILNSLNFPQELLLIKRFFKMLQKTTEENNEAIMKKVLSLSLTRTSERYMSIFYLAYKTSIEKTIKHKILDIKEIKLQDQINCLISIMASMFVVRDFLTFKNDKGINEVYTPKQLKELRSITTQLTNRLGNVLYRLSGDTVSANKLVMDFNYYLDIEREKVFNNGFKQIQGGKVVAN